MTHVVIQPSKPMKKLLFQIIFEKSRALKKELN